ncbi:MAG: SufE family protein [Chloroflexi bacterium]|jgi:cysteine desulfuration protein SufE|nr:SufE family protein [Chloroflexota bacterium]
MDNRKKQLAEDFELLENWEEKYDYLIELGFELPEMPEDLKTEQNLVRGCQSSVWFDIHCEEGMVVFSADSDSLIVKGIVAVVEQLFNGQAAEDVLTADLSFFEELGLWQHLSAQRGNGLMAMIAHLKKAAADCLGQ